MSTQQLFYKAAVPVSKEQHASFSIDTTRDYGFAGAVNSVPLTATEFPYAARDYVIVFAGEEIPMPLSILGVQQDRNAFVSDDGEWQGRYIPAFVRRYPFVFASSEDGSRHIHRARCVIEHVGGDQPHVDHVHALAHGAVRECAGELGAGRAHVMADDDGVGSILLGHETCEGRTDVAAQLGVELLGGEAPHVVGLEDRVDVAQ